MDPRSHGDHPHGRPRGLTLHVYRHRSKASLASELAVLRSHGDDGDDDDEPLPRRPETRAECAEGVRPCPFVSCRHHLYLDVTPHTGGIRLNFPALEPDELGESCSLDVADRGGETLAVIGSLLNMTRERVRQIEGAAIRHVHRLRIIQP